MHRDEDPAEAPRHLAFSTSRRDVGYELAENLEADGSADDPIASVRARPSGRVDADTRSAPVYRRTPGGDVVVPTGRVLVRFAETEVAASHSEELQAVGYILDQLVPYAPHAFWIRAASGGVGDALRGLPRLTERFADAHIEPEMVGTRARKD